MTSLLDGLPAKRNRGTSHRIIRAWLLTWLAAIAGIVASVAVGVPQVAAVVFTSMFVGHFAVVITTVLIQTRARNALGRAEAALVSDPARALAEAKRALSLGLGGLRDSLRAWLVVAQCAEAAGALDDADEALRRGLASPRVPDRGLFVHAHQLWAFVKAARGDLEGAERSLATLGSVDFANPLLHAEYTRARAMLLYRRGAYREVVDVVTEAFARAAVRSPRDAALYEALRRSSMLRLEGEGGHPMRVGAPAGEEAWLDDVAPELALLRAWKTR